MSTIEAQNETALASLTGALVDANDRLLGLLALITNAPPVSLSSHDLIDSIIGQAAPILHLDRVRVSGADTYIWERSTSSRTDAEWETTIALDGAGDVHVAFFRDRSRFDTSDTKLLAAVAKLIANAVATAQVHRRTLQQEVVSREHATAAQVAAAALPDTALVPRTRGVGFFANLTPARETGGDLFTWQEIGPDIWFAIGDVSGKGLAAAVLMSTAVSAIDASILRHRDAGPAEVLAAIDHWLHRRLSNAAMFITLAVGKWNSTTSQLTIVNAGHSPIVWCDAEMTSRVEASAPPLGVIEGSNVTSWTRTTSPGDLLVLATDGFTEQVDATGSLFGEDEFDRAVAAAAGAGSARHVGHTLLQNVADHGADCSQSDDRALLVLAFS